MVKEYSIGLAIVKGFSGSVVNGSLSGLGFEPVYQVSIKA